MDQDRHNQVEAKTNYVKRIMEEQLGRGHIEVGTTCHDLGSVHQKEGRYEEAEKCYKEALEIYKGALEEYNEKSPRPGHPETVATLSGLASLYRTSGGNEEAIQMYERARIICSGQLMPRHVGVVAVRKNYIEPLKQIGGGNEAKCLGVMYLVES